MSSPAQVSSPISPTPPRANRSKPGLSPLPSPRRKSKAFNRGAPAGRSVRADQRRRVGREAGEAAGVRQHVVELVGGLDEVPRLEHQLAGLVVARRRDLAVAAAPAAVREQRGEALGGHVGSSLGDSPRASCAATSSASRRFTAPRPSRSRSTSTSRVARHPTRPRTSAASAATRASRRITSCRGSSARCMSSTARARSAASSWAKSSSERLPARWSISISRMASSERCRSSSMAARAARRRVGRGLVGAPDEQGPGDRDDDRERHRGEDDRAGDHARARPSGAGAAARARRADGEPGQAAIVPPATIMIPAIHTHRTRGLTNTDRRATPPSSSCTRTT